MKTIFNPLKYSAFWVLSCALVSSCTNVYFEKPVPQGGEVLKHFPADWSGVWITEPGKPGENTEIEQIFRECYRFDRISNTRLLVSSELRMQVSDMDKLKKALQDEQDAGTILDYQISENFIFCTLRLKDKTDPEGIEQQFSRLIKQDNWYIFTQTMAPFRLYDLESRTVTEFESQRHTPLRAEWLPDADSLSKKQLRIVVREKDQAIYINSQEDPESKWSLLYIEQPAKGRLIVKTSLLEDSREFETRFGYFNEITPFERTDSSKYLINPTDEALGRLMAEKHLFNTVTLRKLE